MNQKRKSDVTIASSELMRRRKAKKLVSFQGYEELHADHPPTTYMETMMHLFKGNVGTGCYAMADAFKNAGILMGPVLTLIIALICVHAQHMLIRCADAVQKSPEYPEEGRPDYASTMEWSFLISKSERWQKWGSFMKRTCNTFIVITQLGFCSVYFLFVSTNLKSVLDYYGLVVHINVLVVLVLIPISLTALIRQLKYIAIFSAMANFFMIVGIILTVGYAAWDLPDFTERHYFEDIEKLPFYFGTALFAFEGIALVLPLKNAMKKPETFDSKLGVLNVGMVVVTVIYILIGGIGFWKYGEDAKGSLTLNLPTDEILGQVIKLMIALGVMLGYSIQFFVAVQILFSWLVDTSKLAERHPICAELIFRLLLVLVTFSVAVLVPNLSLMLSLVGSVGSVVLAFVLPVLAELVIKHNDEKGIGWGYWLKNIVILLIALAGFSFGGYLGIKGVIEEIAHNFSS